MQRCSLSAQQRTIQSQKGTGAPPHFPELSLRGGAADVAISQYPLGYLGNHRRYRSRLSEIAAAPPGPRNANSGKCRGTSAPLHSSITLYKAVTDRRYRRNRFVRFFTTVSANCGPLTEIATSLRSSQSSRFLNTTINENAGTARSAGGYPPDVPHQFREFRSSMLSSGRQTASILIRLVLPDLPFVMPPVITTLSPGCRCIVSRAARSA